MSSISSSSDPSFIIFANVLSVIPPYCINTAPGSTALPAISKRQGLGLLRNLLEIPVQQLWNRIDWLLCIIVHS